LRGSGNEFAHGVDVPAHYLAGLKGHGHFRNAGPEESLLPEEIVGSAEIDNDLIVVDKAADFDATFHYQV
jgi:hypothetical protein